MTQGLTLEVIRARTWDDYVGQEKMKAQLDITIRARRADGRPLDHTLLEAPPGFGKTTLARIIADQLGDAYRALKMPVREKDFLYFLREFQAGIVLLDELHAAPVKFQELFLTIEDGYIQASNGREVDVHNITFIGATTEAQKIIKPLWDRFLIKPTFENYSPDDMAAILFGMAERLGMVWPLGVVDGLSLAAAGTPRVAGSLVRAARDLQILNEPVTVERVLDLAGVDPDGLTDRHLQYLHTLDTLGGTTGVGHMKTMMRLPLAVIEDLERLLLERGFIRLEPTGRTLTTKGMAKVPRPAPPPRRRRTAA